MPPPPFGKSTTKLPLALQQELGIQDDLHQGQRKRKRGGSSFADRKEKRRDLREDKKDRGPRTRTSRYQPPQKSTVDEFDISDEDIPFVKLDTKPSRTKPPVRTKDISPIPNPKSILKPSKSKLPSPELTESGSESIGSRASSPGLVLDANSKSFRKRAEDDDAEIAALERKLGLKGKKGTKLGDDILDFVLDGLEDESDSKKRKREGQDWLDQKRRKVTRNGGDKLDLATSESDLSDLGGFEDDEDDMFSGSDEEDSEMIRALNSGGSDSDEADAGIEAEDFAGFDSNEDVEEETVPVKRVRENPYVAPVVAGATPAKYIPPSLRKREGDDSGLQALRRQLQGQLNKLSEANIISILGEIEKLYRTNPRQDVTTVLIDLILTSFCIRSALSNTFIILHAAFLAAVYKVMGTDFGAELLVRLVEKFDLEFASAESGKEALNLISLLANLFTFNVVSSHIIYDQIRVLLSNFSEENAELLLRIVRDCGPQLRADDASTLRSIVQTLQDISSDMAKKGQTINIRTRVMMDTITDLKNNKMKNATNAAGMTGEHITRMRKALGSLNNRTLKATEPLRITRDDLANSEKKGKWWLVGASWKGNEKENSFVTSTEGARANNDLSTQVEDEVDLLALAKQYRMNTDVRRSIFVAIMSANDCRDAQTRLLKLRLSAKQEQEIAKVLLRCARAEPVYNPYYALLAKSICKESKKIRMGFQFSLWDFFKRMGESADDEESDDDGDSTVEMHEIVNIAKMFSYLIFHGHLTIGILKTLNIGFLREQATMFLEVLIVSIMTQPKADEESLMKVFGRAADTPQVVKGLQYFIRKNVRKSDLVSKKDRAKVKDGCQIADMAFKMIEAVEAN